MVPDPAAVPDREEVPELSSTELRVLRANLGPRAMLAIGLEVKFETPDKAVCRLLVQCSSNVQAVACNAFLASLIATALDPYVATTVLVATVEDDMVNVEFSLEGIRASLQRMIWDARY